MLSLVLYTPGECAPPRTERVPCHNELHRCDTVTLTFMVPRAYQAGVERASWCAGWEIKAKARQLTPGFTPVVRVQPSRPIGRADLSRIGGQSDDRVGPLEGAVNPGPCNDPDSSNDGPTRGVCGARAFEHEGVLGRI